MSLAYVKIIWIMSRRYLYHPSPKFWVDQLITNYFQFKLSV